MSTYKELVRELNATIGSGQDTETALKIMELERLDRIVEALENFSGCVNVYGDVTTHED